MGKRRSLDEFSDWEAWIYIAASVLVLVFSPATALPLSASSSSTDVVAPTGPASATAKASGKGVRAQRQRHYAVVSCLRHPELSGQVFSGTWIDFLGLCPQGLDYGRTSLRGFDDRESAKTWLRGCGAVRD